MSVLTRFAKLQYDNTYRIPEFEGTVEAIHEWGDRFEVFLTEGKIE